MREGMIEVLESRRLCSATPVQSLIASPAPVSAISLAKGRFKGSSVSVKGFTTRLTISLGKERAGGTIIGTFDYLNGFDFQMHLRVGTDDTFHGVIATGKLSGRLTSGRITTSDHAAIIDLSGHYEFSDGKNASDSGAFLVRN